MLCPSTKSIRLIPVIRSFQFSKPDQKLFKTRHSPAPLNDHNYKISQITDGFQNLILPILFLSLYLHQQMALIAFTQQNKIKAGMRSNSTTGFYSI